ncbi:MAG: hypothetical protein IPL94_03485 [Tetrasphaera sp.]|nr:hypothetical protein [Tetrasphaera sp.]
MSKSLIRARVRTPGSSRATAVEYGLTVALVVVVVVVVIAILGGGAHDFFVSLTD